MEQRSLSVRVGAVLAALVVGGAIFLSPSATTGATTTLAFIPSSATVDRGDTFSIIIVVNAGQAINAAEAIVHYPTSTLEAKSISKTGSIFSLWPTDPTISAAAGTVTFAGGLPSPGHTGNGAKLLTINFTAKATGTARLSMSGARVLANDGFGTDVLSSTGTSTIVVREPATTPTTPPTPAAPTRPAPTVSSESHPDPATWYKDGNVRASWQGGSGVVGYSVVFDDQPGTVPPERSGGLTSTLEQAVGDGTWYLHVRALYDSGWSGTTTFAVHVDTTAPDPFTVTVTREDDEDRTATVTFEATDGGSGVDHYELSQDGGTFAPATSPVTLSNLTRGSHSVAVKAIDHAGNETSADATFLVEAAASPTVFLDSAGIRLLGDDGDLPILFQGDVIRLRGFAPLTSRLIITVRSEAGSVFEFPVADIVDPNPVEPVPSGQSAWKVEISPDLAPGEHEIHVVTVDENGAVSDEAPTIRFRVVTNVFRVGNLLIPYRQALLALSGLVALLTIALVIFIVLYRRARARALRTTLPPPDLLHQV